MGSSSRVAVDRTGEKLGEMISLFKSVWKLEVYWTIIELVSGTGEGG